MNLLETLQKNKQRVQSVLLISHIASPILMFIGIQADLYPLIYFGLVAIILANITAAITK